MVLSFFWMYILGGVVQHVVYFISKSILTKLILSRINYKKIEPNALKEIPKINSSGIEK